VTFGGGEGLQEASRQSAAARRRVLVFAVARFLLRKVFKRVVG